MSWACLTWYIELGLVQQAACSPSPGTTTCYPVHCNQPYGLRSSHCCRRGQDGSDLLLVPLGEDALRQVRSRLFVCNPTQSACRLSRGLQALGCRRRLISCPSLFYSSLLQVLEEVDAMS